MSEQPRQLRILTLDLQQSGPHGRLAEIFDGLESSHPQFGSDWLCNLARHALDDGERAVVYTAEDAAGTLAALPLKIAADGKTAHALANFYTSLYTPATDASDTLSLFTGLFRHLARNEKLSSLTLAPMDGASPVFNTLRDALHAAGWAGVHSYFCFANWVQPLDGVDWPTYLAARPSRVRNTLKRRTRRFFEQDRGHIDIVQGGRELDSAIEQFTLIYRRSWKRPEPYPGFMPALLRLAAARGWLRLGIAYYDGLPIAAQIWLVANRTAYIFKLAYDQQYGNLSPGTVLTAHLMQRVIETDEITSIDYLSGDDAYKRDWMSVRRERRGIAAYNRGSLVGLARFLGYRTRESIKRLTGPVRRPPAKSTTRATRD